MKVYAAQYCPCTHESSFGNLGIYTTREAAQKRCDDMISEELANWKEMGYGSIPEYEVWRVEEYEVLE